jgi:hypothetical protein
MPGPTIGPNGRDLEALHGEDGDHPRDGGDRQGCAACEAPLLYEIDLEARRVWMACSGGCGRFELTPAMIARLGLLEDPVGYARGPGGR